MSDMFTGGVSVFTDVFTGLSVCLLECQVPVYLLVGQVSNEYSKIWASVDK